MYLQTLSVLNFKNYAEAELSFSARINCFSGNNGEGKTNLLDAIHYLSFCKSFFNPIDSQNIRHEETFFMIQGVFQRNEEREEVYCAQKRNYKKQFKRNKKEYTRLADHIGLFPVVMISPADADLISEGSESRRKFMDSVISQYNRNYLDDLINYNKALSQRNALLKRFAESRSFDKESLEVWNDQLMSYGNKIFLERKSFINAFIPTFQQYYELISGGKEKVSLEYISQLNSVDFEELLANALSKDKVLQHSTSGIHKDDLQFGIEKFPVKKFASQGQQKSYLIALKLAQFDFIKKIKNTAPILLLDDIHDRLDELRVQQLMDLVSSEQFGQVFITDTNASKIEALFKGKKAALKMFHIKNGMVS